MTATEIAVAKAIYFAYPLKPRPIDVDLIKQNKLVEKQARAAIRALKKLGWVGPKG